MNKAKKINDINKTNWRDYKHIASSLWQHYSDADPATRKYSKTLKNPPKHVKKQDFHGAFIYQIPEALIARYTCEGDTVLDLFGGSKTTQRAAANASRNSVLVDIAWKPKLKNLRHKKSNTHHLELGFDSANLKLPFKLIRATLSETMTDVWIPRSQLTVLHPPYYDIIKFSSPKLGGDLSWLSVKNFDSLMVNVGVNAVSMTKRGGFIALIFGDVYLRGTLLPAHRVADIISTNATTNNKMNLKAIFIKNISGNEAVKGVNRGLWEYRALVNGFAYFEHEYIYVWQVV